MLSVYRKKKLHYVIFVYVLIQLVIFTTIHFYNHTSLRPNFNICISLRTQFLRLKIWWYNCNYCHTLRVVFTICHDIFFLSHIIQKEKKTILIKINLKDTKTKDSSTKHGQHSSTNNRQHVLSVLKVEAPILLN